MNVEHENRFEAIRRSLQRRRSRSGTKRVIERAKSALMTVASASYSPSCVFTAAILRPSKRSDSTASE